MTKADPDDAEAIEPPDDELRRMLDDRFAAHDRATETSVPWEEVRARLFARE
jgi:putative addiction module component (TIGR02574 family)